MSEENLDDGLERVRSELARYEHPLFNWSAKVIERRVQVSITVKSSDAPIDSYTFDLTERDLNARSFQWDFQRLLYNYLHDYLVEMFTRSPHIRD